jgi:hypothetical protein
LSLLVNASYLVVQNPARPKVWKVSKENGRKKNGHQAANKKHKGGVVQ